MRRPREAFPLIEITPTALKLFGLTVRWYGLLITLGVLLAFLLAARRERQLGLPRDTAIDLVLCGWLTKRIPSNWARSSSSLI